MRPDLDVKAGWTNWQWTMAVEHMGDNVTKEVVVDLQ